MREGRSGKGVSPGETYQADRSTVHNDELKIIITDSFSLLSSAFFFLLQVATFILQKILLDETGLSYICQTYERFSHVAMILVR